MDKSLESVTEKLKKKKKGKGGQVRILGQANQVAQEKRCTGSD